MELEREKEKRVYLGAGTDAKDDFESLRPLACALAETSSSFPKGCEDSSWCKALADTKSDSGLAASRPAILRVLPFKRPSLCVPARKQLSEYKRASIALDPCSIEATSSFTVPKRSCRRGANAYTVIQVVDLWGSGAFWDSGNIDTAKGPIL